MKIVVILIFMISNHVFANDYFSSIEKFERKYSLPKGTLFIISQLESNHHPWTLNINSVPVYLETREQLIKVLEEINNKPYYFKSKDGFHNFYRTLIEAEAGAESLNTNTKNITKLNIKSTDICGTQLNYYWNEDAFNNVVEMTDIDNCLERSAKLLKSHIERHGFLTGAACYHNCDKKADNHKKYKMKFMRAYKRKFPSQFQQLAGRG